MPTQRQTDNLSHDSILLFLIVELAYHNKPIIYPLYPTYLVPTYTV